ncbi:hypothetical protein CVT24_006914 [Panaeolus cyanescens]|uniref:Protein-S-isoprenylcysteine O-methyltransferase n=1 Tax=Panaeolus cyanescens TaxID=181874 RepID=A0A409VK30_9AGAR|nr:hypothetical protein CVT24_006914 [Panaeolus cyanescens]
MSLLRIPLDLAVIWVVHITLTPPWTTSKGKQAPKGEAGFEVSLMPIAVKLWAYIVGLCEISVILASSYPYAPFAKNILALLVHRPVDSARELQLYPLSIFAYAVTFLGGYVRSSCYHALGPLFTFEVGIQNNHKLITTGPYSFVRHPSYTSGSMALLGALLCHTTRGSWAIECSGIFTSWWNGYMITGCWAFALVVASLVIGPRLDKEDSMLREHFGAEWDQYARRVPRKLIPGIY